MVNEMEFVKLVERPLAKEIFMLVGWRQWADTWDRLSDAPTVGR